MGLFERRQFNNYLMIDSQIESHTNFTVGHSHYLWVWSSSDPFKTILIRAININRWVTIKCWKIYWVFLVNSYFLFFNNVDKFYFVKDTFVLVTINSIVFVVAQTLISISTWPCCNTWFLHCQFICHVY